MTHPRQKTAAFTLVEMSIVIVIIGLIVGGVIGGRSYIRNAELNTIMNESKYYINQFNQFQSIYGAVPGDMATATAIWPAIHNGDGNGFVNGGNSNMAELYYAFEHLANASLIKGTYTGLGVGGVGNYDARIGVNLPVASVPIVTYMFDSPVTSVNGGNAIGGGFLWDGLYGHVLRVAGMQITATGQPNASIFSPKEAYQIDDKFDDGNPSTGWVMTPVNTYLTTCSVASGLTYAYNTSNSANSCYLILNLR